MPDDDLKTTLEQIDLSSMTLADLKALKNPSLRDALVDLVRQAGEELASGHQNHGSHSDHSKASMLEERFNPAEVINPEINPGRIVNP